jgi:hypothetical protein
MPKENYLLKVITAKAQAAEASKDELDRAFEGLGIGRGALFAVDHVNWMNDRILQLKPSARTNQRRPCV